MMGLRIYQINLDRDENGMSFESYDCLSKTQPDGIDSRIYDLTFDGYVDAKNGELPNDGGFCTLAPNFQDGKMARQFLSRGFAILK